MQFEKTVAAMLRLRHKAQENHSSARLREPAHPLHPKTGEAPRPGAALTAPDTPPSPARPAGEAKEGAEHTADCFYTEIQMLHPKAQKLVWEAMFLLQSAFHVSKTLHAHRSANGTPKHMYRYTLYAARSASHPLHAYGLQGEEYQNGHWNTVVLTAPFSGSRLLAGRLAVLCTQRQLDPAHLSEAVRDFMEIETGLHHPGPHRDT